MFFGKNNLIPRRNLRCTNCSEPFSIKLEYVTHLFQDERDEWQRADFCATCWKSDKKPKHFWKGTLDPKVEKEYPSMVEHFRKLALSAELAIDQKKELYLITLFLERKKLLIKRSPVGHYEMQLTGEIFMIESYPVPAEEAKTILESRFGDEFC